MMKNIVFLVFLLLILPVSVSADCKKTGSSFSRNQQDCDGDRNVIINNNYTYNEYTYARPYYYHYPPYYYPDYRKPERKGTFTGHYNYSDTMNARERAQDRGYAPGYGTSLPLKPNGR